MRLRDDEYAFLQAINLGDAGAVSLSSARRSALQRKFERNGWTRSGSITPAGERMLSRQTHARAVGPAAVAEASNDLESPDKEERQSDDGDIQGPSGEGVVDSA